MEEAGVFEDCEEKEKRLRLRRTGVRDV